MGSSEFEQWKFYFNNESVLFRSAAVNAIHQVAFEISILRHQIGQSVFFPKSPFPKWDEYFPTKLKKEQTLSPHVKARRRMNDEEFELYRLDFFKQQRMKWGGALNIDTESGNDNQSNGSLSIQSRDGQ